MSAGLINQREVIMNKIDRYIERLTYELGAVKGWNNGVTQFQIKELQAAIAQGHNSRAEIVRLLKLSGANK